MDGEYGGEADCVGGVSSPNSHPPSSSDSTMGSGIVAYRDRVWSGGTVDFECETMMGIEYP